MKLLFYHPNENAVRTAPLSYTSLRNGCGFSGTETAFLEMSKYLADKGHLVQIYGVGNTYIDANVKYIAEHEIEKVDLDVDWYSPIFFCDTASQKKLLNRLNPTRTKVLLWFQCFIEDKYIKEIQQRFRVYGQFLCSYVANSYPHILDKSHSWIIYNGINKYFTTRRIPISAIKKGNWIFHASYERGGNIAQQIFNKMNATNSKIASKLNILSYYTPDSLRKMSSLNIINQGSKTKIEVRELLLISDYFVYPLVLDNNQVHHDTFGSVMLEALACGTIVVVWDVACISSVYSNYVVKITVPDNVKQNYNPQARYASCSWMRSDEAQQLFIDKINELESDKAKKELIRARGAEWARTIIWDSLGEDMEKQLLTH